MSLEQKITTRAIADAEGITTRWLAQLIAAGRFPKPDFPAEQRGAPHRWLLSTVEKWRAEKAAATPAPNNGKPPPKARKSDTTGARGS